MHKLWPVTLNYWKWTSHLQESFTAPWISHLITLKAHYCSLLEEDTVRNEFILSQTASHLLAVYLPKHNSPGAGPPFGEQQNLQRLKNSSEGIAEHQNSHPQSKTQCSALPYMYLTAWCGLHFSVLSLVLGVRRPNDLRLIVSASCFVSSSAICFPWLCHWISFQSIMENLHRGVRNCIHSEKNGKYFSDPNQHPLCPK